MDGEGIESESDRLTKVQLTKEQRKAIGQLSLEWGVLDSTERLISRLMDKHYERERLQPGMKRPPELVELESQQWKIFERKREISTELVELEEGLVPRRRKPGRRSKLIVQLRDMFIRECKHQSDKEICKQLDFELGQRETPALGLPENWTAKYRVRTYYDAYRHSECKGLVQKLISAAKASY